MPIDFWGKARPDTASAGARFHALDFHALDVAAIAEILLDLFPAIPRGLAEAGGVVEEDARRLIVRLAALHDIGKHARGFQGKVPDLWPAVFGPFPDALPSGDHTAIGLQLLGRDLRPDFGAIVSDFSFSEWRPLLMAVVGHHGRPVLRQSELSSDEIGRPAIAAAKAWIGRVCDLVHGPTFAGDLDEKRSARLSLPLAGFINLADWIGSNQAVFGYREAGDRAEYWETVARPAALRAVERAGIRPSLLAKTTGFAALTGLKLPPSPLQAWTETVELPGAGPVLALVEDTTGAGKTEAAVILAHRLMLAGRGDGIYVALPTQATADAMYRRLAMIHRRLFAEEARPSLALAHGAAGLDEVFRRSIVDVGADERRFGAGDDGETASSSCAAWIADDRRKAFFADVGAGTIDQAFLAVLPAKFAPLRLLGLSRRVLIIDEAHCYGAYESEELTGLIAFHAAQGGATIVLSATLSVRIKDRLVAAFRRGCGEAGPVRRHDWPAVYPAATLVAMGSEPRVDAVETRADRRARVAVARLPDTEAAVAAIVEAAGRGGAVAWIRNAVDDVLEGAALLARQGLEPIVFHARFAMVDRQAIEAEVTRVFGKTSSPEMRRGRVIVASQVVEQSLDLDFDLMVSDLAPIDLLIQRAGRVWRHAGRPRPLGEPRLLVVSPAPAPDAGREWFSSVFPKAAWVYRNHALLWRSAEVLFAAGAIVSPGEIRGLVEAVYGAGALDDVPIGLERSWIEADGEDRAAASQAEGNLLRLEEGYVAHAGWSPDVLTPTRLGDERRILRLARWDGVRLTPWAPIVDPADRFAIARAWALSEVSVRASRVSGRGAYAPEIDRAAAAIEEIWRERGDGRSLVLPILPDESPAKMGGKLRGRSTSDYAVRYSSRTGLSFASP